VAQISSGNLYTNTFTATSSSVPYLITSGSGVTWAGGAGGGIGGAGCAPYYPPEPVPAKPPTALERLDAAIEKTCARARAA
jgi:hypothetical protein